MARTQQQQQSFIVDLAEKFHVSVTIFKSKPYFHIRHNENSKNVSLNLKDMTALVQKFPLMKRKLKRLQMKAAASSKKQKKQQKKMVMKKLKGDSDSDATIAEDDEVDDDVDDEIDVDDDDEDDVVEID